MTERDGDDDFERDDARSPARRRGARDVLDVRNDDVAAIGAGCLKTAVLPNRATARASGTTGFGTTESGTTGLGTSAPGTRTGLGESGPAGRSGTMSAAAPSGAAAARMTSRPMRPTTRRTATTTAAAVVVPQPRIAVKTAPRTRRQTTSRTRRRQEAQQRRKSRRPLVITIAAVVALILVAGGIYYWLSHRDLVDTDDAYTDGRAVAIAPRVSGQVVSLDVTDNQFVHKGDPLIHIDPRQYVYDRDQAKGAVDTAKAQIDNQSLGVEIARKNFPASLLAAQGALTSAKANLLLQQSNYDRQKSLPKQATTQQEVDTSTSNFQQAQARCWSRRRASPRPSRSSRTSARPRRRSAN